MCIIKLLKFVIQIFIFLHVMNHGKFVLQIKIVKFVFIVRENSKISIKMSNLASIAFLKAFGISKQLNNAQILASSFLISLEKNLKS